MVYFSKKSGGKIVHFFHCPYYQHMDKRTVGIFDTLDAARTAGYKVCKHCAAMAKYYRKERRCLNGFAARSPISYEYSDGAIDVWTPYSQWKIITNGKAHRMFLYHKNEYEKKGQVSMVPGYHSQAFRSDTILGYFQFIIDHDAYRFAHPLDQPKLPEIPPRKGSKRFRRLSKKERALEREAKVRRTLALIRYESMRHPNRSVAI